MLSQNRSKRSATRVVPLLIASTLLAAASAHAAETARTPLVLTAYINGPGGESLLAGHYSQAFAEMSKARPQNTLAASTKATNLCVAYAATRKLTEARDACDVALRLAKAERLSSSRYSPGTMRENADLAAAYTNRAVVRMLMRDAVSAKADLQRAQLLAPHAEFVVKNVAAVANVRAAIAQADVTTSR